MEQGIAQIPIAFDDFALHQGIPYEQWEARALARARGRQFLAFSLHDCYGPAWLPHYRSFLERLSDSAELPLRLRWLGVLSGTVDASLAAAGGVHTVVDVVQAVMAGANAVQMVSALLHHGPQHLSKLRHELAQWLEEHEYGSLREMRGSMSLRSCPDPEAYERATYMLMLQSWKPAGNV